MDRISERSSTYRRRWELAESVARMVAHWFQLEDEERFREVAAAQGLFRGELRCGPDVSYSFWVTREAFVDEAFLRRGQDLLDRAGRESDRLAQGIEDERIVQKRYSSPLEVELLQRDLALYWLNRAEPRIEWERLLAYAEYLRHRTYENDPVSVNLVVDPAREDGTLDIDVGGGAQKVLDPLSASLDVFIKVDKQLRIVDFVEVEPVVAAADDVGPACPSFLLPIVQLLGPGQFSFHRTRRGDVVIANRRGLVAAWRKGNWYVYEVPKLTLTLQDLCGFAADRLSESLVSLIWDLSYKRHGALLVFDPSGSVVDKVDPSQHVGAERADSVRATFAPSVRLVDLTSDAPAKWRKKLVGQIACVDGAVIFGNQNIRAFGAIVPPAGNPKASPGTRTLAAYSSRELGGTAVKISADGDVLIPLFLGVGERRFGATLRFA